MGLGISNNSPTALPQFILIELHIAFGAIEYVDVLLGLPDVGAGVGIVLDLYLDLAGFLILSLILFLLDELRLLNLAGLEVRLV